MQGAIKVLSVIFCVITVFMFSGCKEKFKPDSAEYKEKLAMLENGLKELKSLVAQKQAQELLIAKLRNRAPIQFPEDKDIKKFEKRIAAARTNKPSVKELERIMKLLLIKTEKLKNQISNIEAILTSDPEPGL